MAAVGQVRPLLPKCSGKQCECCQAFMSGRRARAQSRRRAGSSPMGLVPTAFGNRTTAVLNPVHSSDSRRRTMDASSVCKAGPKSTHDGRHQSSRPAALPGG
eukprot:6481935-Amphidinium_carterae.1